MVICAKEQEEAVNLIAEDVATIRVAGQDLDNEDDEDEDETYGRVPGSSFSTLKDTQTVNAAEYKM